MSRTYKDIKKGKYNKAFNKWMDNDFSWVNWYPSELFVTAIHEPPSKVKLWVCRFLRKKALLDTWFGKLAIRLFRIRVNTLFERFFSFPSNDGHGIAEFSLKPKPYRVYHKCYVKHWSGHDNLYHTRPTRRWNKRQLQKLEIYVDLDTGVWYTNDLEFRNYRKPHEYED